MRYVKIVVPLLLLLFLITLRLSRAGDDHPIPALALLREAAFQAEGATYSVVNGEAYKLNNANGKWTHVAHLYDPDFFKKNYVVQDGVVHRVAEDGTKVPMRKTFSSGFEEARTLPELIGLKYGWTSFTLQSPAAPTIADYVALRNHILRENGAFIDNRVEPSRDLAHTGSQALKTVSTAKSRGMICAKASIDTELLHFTKGDDFWFSGWFYIKEGQPFTLLDLESTWIAEASGIRVMFEDDQFLMVELKWAHKPTYRQPQPKRIAFPKNRWVQVRLRFRLSEKADGIVQLWQDGNQLIDAQGQTLPLKDTIYNSLELGISATHQAATMYVDDIEVSDKPLK